MKRILLLAALLVAASQPIFAQSSNLIYGSSRNPLMNSVNPAFFPNNSRIYLALPNVNLDLASPVAYSDLFTYIPEEQRSVINANQLLDNLTTNNILFNTNVHAVGLGINTGRIFLTASVQAKVNLMVGLPNGLATLIQEGNVNHLGPDNPIELLDGQLISLQSYAEGAVGLGLKLGDHMTVGLRGKLLVGAADFSNAGSSLKLYTAEDYSSLAADLDVNFHLASTIVSFDTAKNKVDIKEPTGIPNNRGFNFDIGARYSNDLFELSASLLDLGPGIHWTEGIQRVVSKNEDNRFEFSGIDISNVMQGGSLDSNIIGDLKDSLMQMVKLKFIDNDQDDYWTVIPTKINIGGMFHLTKGVSAGVLFHGEFERGTVKKSDLYETKVTGFHSNTSLIARVNLADWVEVIAATSVINSNDKWDWVNPGIGLTLTPLRTIQIYTFLDYISNIYLVDAKQFNISLGVNLLLGRDSKKQDYDEELLY